MTVVRKLLLALGFLALSVPLRLSAQELTNPEVERRSTTGNTIVSGTVVGSDEAGSTLRTSTTRHFVLRTNTPPEFARSLGQKLDSYYDQLMQLLPRLLGHTITPVRASVILFEHQDGYQRYARRHAPQLVNNGGYYDGATRTIVTYRYNNSLQLYFHEILHSVMGEVFDDHYFFRYSKANWPIWFDEGLAELFGSFRVDGAEIRIGARNRTKVAYLLNALAAGTFVGLQQLLVAESERYSGSSMNLYYAEAWGLLDFLTKTEPYRYAVPRFFAAVKANQDGLKAFTECFGSDLDDLDRRWRAHLWSLASIPGGWLSLFNGESIDDWTVHEGGAWTAESGVIRGVGDENYNYLIRSELPYSAFTLTMEVRLEEGTTGIILGNNYHGEYPYHYLIDLARDQVTLRRSHSATRIRTLKETQPHVPEDEWLPVTVEVKNDRLRVWVNGQQVLDESEDRDRFSLFGVYLYQGKAQFRQVRLRNELPTPPAAPTAR